MKRGAWCVCACACACSGNTALHVAVVHEQLDMYDHLVEYCGAWEHVRNNRGATPLLLAASMGKMEVFQHIYNRRCGGRGRGGGRAGASGRAPAATRGLSSANGA